VTRSAVALVVIVSPENIHRKAIIHVYMNDGMIVNVWQDETVDEEPGIRFIEDVDTLRALAEPTRLAILTALLKPPWPRVMSVKEMAGELDMAPTRLYRHVRQLEEADLIKVAETRMVSGILEQRYQASERDVRFGREILRTHPDESRAAFHVLVDRFAEGLLAASPERGYKPLMFMSDRSIPAEAADELQRRLRDIHDWLGELPEDPYGVAANVMLGFYVS
jgi:DNA-binding transcriptional ArsR family regulator